MSSNSQWAFVALLVSVGSAFGQDAGPKATDPRLVVELVAAQPDIVHPVACDFDHKGRLLVVESHTHFAPQGYKGPKFDRILAFDVAKRGKPTVFFEGTRHTMDIATHPSGAIYIATRNEILRLRDTKGTGVADEKTRIVFLDTKGDYPHNGLSGLCFDANGDLTFGMGENLGAAYKLIGSDGQSFSGQGDGGHIFHCTADGKKLRRVATGFWNPFGICRDIFGRTFAVDNDPDQSPPCRMLHVVEGGDYGFRFCYGRSGKHPFQSWHGELPGTLPMMTGVGEAPCEILSYESDGLPSEYLGQVLVTSWADHRVERYKVVPHGASFKAERLPFVQGGANFRPTGMCVAPDGSLYVTDWVLSNYTLHGKGAIWNIREKASRERKRPEAPREAIFSMHRPLREMAAMKLTREPEGESLLRKLIETGDTRVRAAALTFGHSNFLDLGAIVENDKDLGLRQLAFPYARDGRRFLDKKYPPALRADAMRFMKSVLHAPELLDFLEDSDPFLHHRAVQQGLAQYSLRLALKKDQAKLSSRQRLGLLQMQKQFEPSSNPGIVRPFLEDPDETIRFLAVKWIADERADEYRDDIVKAMSNPKLSVRMVTACATALARIDGKDVNEKSLADSFASRLADDKTPPAQRSLLLRQVPATHPKLTVDLLAGLLKSDDASLKFEAVRALAEHPNKKKHEPLLATLRDAKLSPSIRGFALLGLTERSMDLQEELFALAKAEPRLHGDVERAVSARVPPADRPPAKDLDAWLKRLDGPADAEVGARVFFHPRVGCSKCHRIDGRGADVGPDLSSIGRTDRRHLLESILQPSNTVAPRYVAWMIETVQGKVLTGVLLHTQLDEYTYLDANANQFKIKTGDIAEQRASTMSIMPEGLIDRITDQEMRDLIAYLQSRK